MNAFHDIFTTFRGGFGDCWAAASFLLKRSETTQTATYTQNIDVRIREIADHLSTSGAIVQLCDRPTVLISNPQKRSIFLEEFGYLPQRQLSWAEMFAEEYLPTYKVWRESESRLVTYQLEPTTPGRLTCCRPGEIDTFIDSFIRRGYRVVALGNHFTLSDNIALACESELFVGIDSGISHLCHSVRVPVHLIRNALSSQHLHVTHKGNKFYEHNDLRCFLKAME